MKLTLPRVGENWFDKDYGVAKVAKINNKIWFDDSTNISFSQFFEVVTKSLFRKIKS